MGYCPSACAGSRYRELYRDTELGIQALARDKRHDTTRLSCSKTLRHGQEARRHGRPTRRASVARAHGLAVGGCVAIKMGIS